MRFNLRCDITFTFCAIINKKEKQKLNAFVLSVKFYFYFIYLNCFDLIATTRSIDKTNSKYLTVDIVFEIECINLVLILSWNSKTVGESISISRAGLFLIDLKMKNNVFFYSCKYVVHTIN